MHVDPAAAQPADRLVRHRARVAPDHLLAARAQRERGGHARAGEADDEERAGRQRRTRDHAAIQAAGGAGARRGRAAGAGCRAVEAT